MWRQGLVVSFQAACSFGPTLAEREMRSDSSSSTSFSNTPGTRQVALFSTGADSIPFTVAQGASGNVVHDTVALGNLTVASQEFLLCDKYADVLDVM